MICCVNFPTCDSYVGTHAEDQSALGRLANRRLRRLRKAAHDRFDIIWRQKHYERSELYDLLSEYLGIPEEFTHIGWFNETTCRKTINWSKKLLKEVNGKDNT